MSSIPTRTPHVTRATLRGVILGSLGLWFSAASLAQPAAESTPETSTPAQPAPAQPAPTKPKPAKPTPVKPTPPAPASAETPAPKTPAENPDPAAAPAKDAPSDATDGTASDVPAPDSEDNETLTETPASDAPPTDDDAEATATADSAAERPKSKRKKSANKPAPAPSPYVSEERPPLLPSQFSVQLFWDSVRNTDPGYDLFSSSDTNVRLGIALTYDLLRLSPQLALAVELGYSHEETSREQFDSSVFEKANLDADHWHAGAALRYEVFPWLVPHARLRAGVSFVDAEFRTTFRQASVQEETVSPFAILGAGVSFQTPELRVGNRDHAMHLGILFEWGYLVAPSLSFAIPDRSPDGTEQRLAVRGAPLGDLDRSGNLFQTALFLRF